MASETVKKILEAEAAADRSTAEARKKAEDIITEARKSSAVSIQKKLAEAKAEAEKIKKSNAQKLKEYSAKAEKRCSDSLGKLKQKAEKNTDKAVAAVIAEFFG